MTFSQILKTSPLPRKEIEILIAFLLKKDREFLTTYPETIVNETTYKKLETLIKKRLAGWSSAVLIGQKDFYGLTFKVDKNVLVPRPETEIMVDEVVKLINQTEATKQSAPKIATWKNTALIDIGTGSGAIIITSASELKRVNRKQYQQTNFLGIDISPLALKTAKQNAAQNGLGQKIKFVKGNLLTPLINNKTINKNINCRYPNKKNFISRLIITANLPYLTPQQIKASPSIQKEPLIALVAGSDGLKYYRELFKQLKGFCLINNLIPRSLTVLCEIDPSQKIKIKTIVKKLFPNVSIEIQKDLAGKARLAIIKI